MSKKLLASRIMYIIGLTLGIATIITILLSVNVIPVMKILDIPVYTWGVFIALGSNLISLVLRVADSRENALNKDN